MSKNVQILIKNTLLLKKMQHIIWALWKYDTNRLAQCTMAPNMHFVKNHNICKA